MDYTIGIDVGKEELVTCIRSSQSGLAASPVSFPNSSIGIKQFMRKLADDGISLDTPILLESTGPYHWAAAHILTVHHYLAKVVNPIHTKQIARLSVRKRKTDKVDAAQLAFLASQGYGYPFRETEDMAQRKALVRHWWKLRATATAHLLHERYLDEFRGISRFRISPLLLKKCDVLKKEIVSLCSHGNDLRYLDSIPGVSPFLGATILTELTPLDRFERVEQVVAYAGLDPSVKQSGGKAARYGKVSKRGSPILRHALFLAAWGSFTRTPFRPLYLRYKKRGLHHTTVMCILSRKILRIAYALLTKRTIFDAHYLTVDTDT